MIPIPLPHLNPLTHSLIACSLKNIHQIIHNLHNLDIPLQNLIIHPPATSRLAVFIQHQLLLDETPFLLVLFLLAPTTQNTKWIREGKWKEKEDAPPSD